MQQYTYQIKPLDTMATASTIGQKPVPVMPMERSKKSILESEVIELYRRSETLILNATSSLVEKRIEMGNALIELQKIIKSEETSWKDYIECTFEHISQRTVDVSIRIASSRISREFYFLGLVTLNKAISAADSAGAATVNDWLHGIPDLISAETLREKKLAVDAAITEAKRQASAATKLVISNEVEKMLTEIGSESVPTAAATSSSERACVDEDDEPEEDVEIEDVEAEDEAEDEDETEEEDKELQDTADAESGGQKEQVATEVLEEFFQHVEGILALDEQAELRSAKIDQAQNDKIAKTIEILTAIHISN